MRAIDEAAYVAKYGPVVIGLDTTNYWQQYKGGVLTQGPVRQGGHRHVLLRRLVVCAPRDVLLPRSGVHILFSHIFVWHVM